MKEEDRVLDYQRFREDNLLNFLELQGIRLKTWQKLRFKFLFKCERLYAMIINGFKNNKTK